ncbi:RES family NAD+ phosphorylase [Labilibaculum euxinus]
MKIYRAIEFSQLIWLTTDDATLMWESLSLRDLGNGNVYSNWWLRPENINERRQIVTDICSNSNEPFFRKSLDYNAMQGGRFNPSRSFGVIYSSSNPLVSALEVLFHQYYGALPLYSKMSKDNNRFTSSFNVNIPRKLDSLIIVFEIEIDDEYCNNEICGDKESLITECEKIGFKRYIGDNFTRDFIFGNDYEISRLLGAYIHSFENATFKVPSARLDYEIQDEFDIRNYIIPEKNYNPEKMKLTGRYFEYRSKVNLEKSIQNTHEVEVEVIGSDSSKKLYFNLDSVPNKRTAKHQYVKYEPNSNNPNDRKNHYREVEIQKFKTIKKS